MKTIKWYKYTFENAVVIVRGLSKLELAREILKSGKLIKKEVYGGTK